MQKPDVSVVITYFNNPEYLSDLFASIAMQSEKNVEVIVVDDGSGLVFRQKLDELALLFQSELNIRCIHSENGGVSSSRNLGIAESKGEFVVLFDPDDMMCGRYSLAQRMQFLTAHPDFGGVAGYPVAVDQGGKQNHNPVIKLKFQKIFLEALTDPLNTLKYYCQNCVENTTMSVSTLFFAAGSAMYRRSAIKDILFNAEYDLEEDVEWLIRFLSLHTLQLQLVPYHFRRTHDNQYHLRTPEAMTQRVLEIARRSLANILPS